MRFLSLFSGIEAASMAWTPLGWEPAAFSEIEPFPCSVLQHHYPHVPNLGDVTKITRQQVEALGRIDLVCGGFPCQDLSAAGKRKGLMNADGSPTRSGLFFDAMRIAEWTRARWTVLENVPGLFSSNGGRDFAAVVGEMAGCEFDVPPGGWENAGVAVGPLGLIEWITLDAQYVRVESHPRAVPQRRRRVFLVRDSGNWANRPPLFLERESLRGHPAPRREAGQESAVCPTLRAGGNRTGGDRPPGTDVDTADSLQAVAFGGNNQTGPIDVATARNACASASGRMDFESETFLVQPTHTLRGEGFDASEDGTGRGTPLVPMAYATKLHNTGSNNAGKIFEERTTCLDANSPPPALLTATQVRRLTAVECERLMGFPDGYTAIPWRKKPASECPDGPRYKSLGNSWAVNCARWIGERIEAVETIVADQAELETA